MTIPEIALGSRETIWDLSRWLYRGAAGAHHRTVYAEIRAGRWGEMHVGRVELVRAIHTAITSKIVRGGARATARNEVIAMNSFVRWVDGNGHLFESRGVIDAYMHWTDSLAHDAQVRKIFSNKTAYSRARAVGVILDLALERRSAIIRSTRLKQPGAARKVQGARSENQNLEETFAFGRLLQDICDAITLDALWGPSPLRIPLSGGGELLHYSGRPAPPVAPSTCESHIRRFEKRKERFDNDKTLRTRYPIANMRILAELLTFIAQTGMNLAQAHQLTLCQFSYASDVDGYKVRDYKARRRGEVLFVIFREYRSHFERYLAWRRSVFPADSRLFPVFRFTTFVSTPPCFIQIQQACRQVGVRWITPRVLRSTRINWLLRRSGDPDLTAEMAQHHRQSLLENYARPSLQRTMGEVTRFWRQTDPHLALSSHVKSIAPGECDGAPCTVPDRPRNAPLPDCTRASGCLWCEHHRDIDSQDYVWALSCFRHLKILEMARYRPALGDRITHPAEHAIDRISRKLTWFQRSNATRRSWVEESLTRVEEGDYHPEWKRLIVTMEGGEG
ncbi:MULTISPECIES: site-specific integrase [Paraburkholderia]|uniref:site-specific integrase n=1 Tax=Paraburkholderia TaxID=1822464 RepID=UPI002AB767AB|nr:MULTISPECIES: site-specific integrase [Paraburkholderia]